MSNLGKSYCTSQMTNKDLPKPTYFEDNHNFLKLFSTPFSFSNRLNDIIPLFSDECLNENEPNIKINFKNLIPETYSPKCEADL